MSKNIIYNFTIKGNNRILQAEILQFRYNRLTLLDIENNKHDILISDIISYLQ